MRNVSGITLIALVITIIILLILAGVSISALSQSFIERAELTSAEMNQAFIKDKIQLICSQKQIDEYSNSEKTNLKTEIEKIDGIQNVRIEEMDEECIYIEFDYNDMKHAFNFTGAS